MNDYTSALNFLNLSPAIMIGGYVVLSTIILGLFFWKAREAFKAVLGVLVLLGLALTPPMTAKLLESQTTLNSQAAIDIRIIRLTQTKTGPGTTVINFTLNDFSDAYIDITDDQTGIISPALPDYALEKKRLHNITVVLKPGHTGHGTLILNGRRTLWLGKPLVFD